MPSAAAAESRQGLSVYRRLLGYAFPYWRVFVPGVLGMVIYASTESGMAAVLKPMVDGSLIARDPEIIRTVPLLFLGLFFVRGVSNLLATYCTKWVGRRVIADMRAGMFRHLLVLPSSFYDSTSSGLLISKLIYNVEQVAAATTKATTVLIRDSVMVLGLISWMVYINALLATVFLVVGPIVAGLVAYVSKRFRRISRSIQDSVGHVTHAAEEAIEAHRVVKAYGGQGYETGRFLKVNERNRRLHMKMVFTDAASVPIIQITTASGLAGIVYMASVDTFVTHISAGSFVSFIAAMGLVISPVRRLTAVNSVLQQGIAAGESIFVLLDEEAERDTGCERLQSVDGRIEFCDVSLAYTTGKGRVLHNVDLTVAPGETVAIVGRSGSGKSSLVNLIPRFYEVSSGELRIDGRNVHDLLLADLRAHMALVSQEVVLFNDTVRANIAYGSMVGCSEAAIVQAARDAHALEFIERLPDGFDTLVGENGVLLSGGQRQRLALARAFLKEAPILILDEATSALDSESERHIQRALRVLMRQRTTLVVAHRLSTIEEADRIIVLADGRIVEIGTHRELLAAGGHYTGLYNIGFQEEEDESARRTFGDQG